MANYDTFVEDWLNALLPIRPGFHCAEDGEWCGVSGRNTRVVEKEDSTVLEMSLPGVDPTEISVATEDDVLLVSRKVPLDGQDCQRGSFVRRFHIEGVDQEAITAQLKHGLLTVILPKRAPKGRSIPIT
jgi:HSP20 family molecular chaperone IbpA